MTQIFTDDLYEGRYSPFIALVLVSLVLLVMALIPRMTIHTVARLFFSGGAGFFGFGLFLVMLGMVYAERLVWATF